MRTLYTAFLTACICALSLGNAAAQGREVDQSALSGLLSHHVSPGGWVDYVGLRQDRATLQSYLDTLRSVDVAKLPSDTARLAFWINAYNAFTLNDVLEYVDGKTDSVKKVNGFFDKNKHSIAGGSLTLDEMERRGRNLHNPRIHFAINCASASCPRLQPFAYTAAELDRQLDQVTAEFFADQNRGLRLQQNENTVFLSPIMEWYAGDFSGATSTTGEFLSRARAAISGENVVEFVVSHAGRDAASYIRQNRPKVKYMGYDWTLNSQKLHPQAQ